MPKLSISREQAIHELWRRGDLRFKYRPVQYRMRKAWQESKAFSKQFVLHVSRQTGKSFFLTSLAIEEGLKNEKVKIIYVAPVKDKLKDFIGPIIETILQDCPADMRPVLVGNTLQFKNNSVINFYGAVNESYKHIRGAAAYMVIIDEAGFMDSLEEIMSMIRPVLLRSQGFLILSSSSPISGDHPFATYIEQARKEGWYFLSTINDDETVTPQQKAELVRQYRGEHTTGYRRELLCEIVTETERAIVPEWKDEFVQEIEPDQFFPYYHTYAAVDI